MRQIFLTIEGRPTTKKNSQKIIMCGNRPRIVQSDAYRQYEHDSLRQIPGTTRKGLSGRMNLCCRYWMADKRLPDLLNLLAATSDILEKAGVVGNDRDFVRVDGSEIVGVDKDRPRVEITITKLMEAI